jgi:hypothetical protein
MYNVGTVPEPCPNMMERNKRNQCPTLIFEKGYCDKSSLTSTQKDVCVAMERTAGFFSCLVVAIL